MPYATKYQTKSANSCLKEQNCELPFETYFRHYHQKLPILQLLSLSECISQLFYKFKSHRMKVLFLCLLLSITLAQINFNNNCHKDSLIPLLATGTVNLNLLDTYYNGANKDYYQSLSLSNFSSNDFLGYGFSLTGFQTVCINTYYTLIIDSVTFENQNTRMKIVVAFRNPGDGSVTLWSLVSFSYIVVSKSLSGTYSDIWASVAEVNNPIDGATTAIDKIGLVYQTTITAGSCKIYTDPSYTFSTTCPITGANTASAPTTSGKVIIHTYIMGFMWNPSKTTAQYLSAGVLPTLTSPGDQATGAVQVTTPFGPKVTLYNPDAALEYIKVAFVLSRFDSVATTSIPPTYPQTVLLYSSSYLFTAVTTFNTPVVAVQGSYVNKYYYHLPDTRYAIFGVTRFSLPKNANTTCSIISINATLNNIDSFTISTPNTNPKQFFFQADIFTKSLSTLCNTDPVNSPLSTQILTVGQKSYSTTSTQSLQQFILEGSTIVPPFYTSGYVGYNFMYYAAKNGNTDLITFKVNLKVTGLTLGAPLKFEFGYFEKGTFASPIIPIIGDASAGMLIGNTYFFQLAVNGFILYQNTHTAKDNIIDLQSNTNAYIYKGLTSNGTTANVVITVAYNRSIFIHQNVWTYLRVFQYTRAYNPSTGCCVTGCSPLSGLDVQLDPPVCIYCNANAGLTYNPLNGTCTCMSGYYLDAMKTYQCNACYALFCSVCNPINPAQCKTCVVGATLNNITLTCMCGSGFFVNGITCQKCPYPCQNCTSPNGACSACSDASRRDLKQSCKCISGFFDSGQASCSACYSTCLTCTNSSACASCDDKKYRNLTETLCACINGYYQVQNADLTRTCSKCNPECLTCQASPAFCTSCDDKKKRVPGVGPTGVSTCVCNNGHSATSDDSCAQSSQNADPFYSYSLQDLKKLLLVFLIFWLV